MVIGKIFAKRFLMIGRRRTIFEQHGILVPGRIWRVGEPLLLIRSSHLVNLRMFGREGRD